MTAALAKAQKRLEGDGPVSAVSTNVLLGTTTLDDGRPAQIQIFLTANPDDFIDLSEGEINLDA